MLPIAQHIACAVMISVDVMKGSLRRARQMCVSAAEVYVQVEDHGSARFCQISFILGRKVFQDSRRSYALRCPRVRTHAGEFACIDCGIGKVVPP